MLLSFLLWSYHVLMPLHYVSFVSLFPIFFIAVSSCYIASPSFLSLLILVVHQTVCYFCWFPVLVTPHLFLLHLLYIFWVFFHFFRIFCVIEDLYILFFFSPRSSLNLNSFIVSFTSFRFLVSFGSYLMFHSPSKRYRLLPISVALFTFMTHTYFLNLLLISMKSIIISLFAISISYTLYMNFFAIEHCVYYILYNKAY